jgi:Domain of Unknown Function (DUF1080)
MRTLLIAPILFCCLLVQAQKQTVSQTLAVFPFQRVADAAPALQTMQQWKPAQWKDFFVMLDTDSLKLKPSYALHAYVNAASLNMELRKKTATNLSAGLTQVKGFYAKDFLIQRLGLLGDDAGVKALEGYLQDNVYAGVAARSLVSIQSAAARATLNKALATAVPPIKEQLQAALNHQSVNPAKTVALSNYYEKKNLAALEKAMTTARDLPTKRDINNAASRINDSASFQYISQFLGFLADPELRSDAANSLARMALVNTAIRGARVVTSLENAFPFLNGVDSAILSKKLVEADLVKPAGNIALGVITAAEKQAGFKVLFDGTNTNQWTGNTAGYLVEDGALVVHPEIKGGNLYTKEEFGDFVYRFEFLLTPGANNGIGIRAPLEGDAAYVGMEIQVLDNEADKYKALEKYQYHGSVYGVMPARRGYLKATGEWNTEEISIKGSAIKVTLNGVVILEGDIAETSKNGTMDHKEHPGLLRPTGHIGFLGHGDVVKFRNMRIKAL